MVVFMEKQGSKFKRNIFRNCSICGKKVKIRHYVDGGFFGNIYYYGILDAPIEGTGEYKNVGTCDVGPLGKVPVSKWTGKTKKFEYWECEDCFLEGCFESTLEDNIEDLYGKRCKRKHKNCKKCNVWELYDRIIKYNRKLDKKEINNK